MSRPPFHWQNQGLIPPIQGGAFQLAGCKTQHLPCPMSSPIQTPLVPLAESGPDSANAKGGISIGRVQEAACTMSDEPANSNTPCHWRHQGLILPMERGARSPVRPPARPPGHWTDNNLCNFYFQFFQAPGRLQSGSLQILSTKSRNDSF